MPFLLFLSKTAALLVPDIQFSGKYILLFCLLLLLGGVLFVLKKQVKIIRFSFFLVFFLSLSFFESEISLEKEFVFTGKVLEVRPKKERQNLIVENGSSKVWASYTGKEEILAGWKIEASGSFYPVKEKNWFYSENITHTGYVKNLKIIEKTEEKNSFKAYFIKLTGESLFPFLHQGFFLGEKRYIPESVLELFKQNGVLHLLAVSGMHIGMVAFFVFFILKSFPLHPKITLVLFLAVIHFYLYLLDYSPASVRAVVFTTMVSAAKILERRVKLLDMVYLSGWLILMVNPRMLYSIGFIISFSAAFAIIFTLPFTQKISAFFKNKLLKNLSASFFIGLFVQIFIFPLILFVFGSFNFLSLFLTIPLSFLLSLSLGWLLSALLLSLASFSLAGILISASDSLNYLMMKTMELTLPLKWFEIHTGIHPVVLGLYYLLLLGGAFYAKKKWKLKEIFV
ncbi:MAG TPA: hypothetical protein DHW82_04860 [Spirochaetia bacterium]|nr:MAG: hypothetical protein A2Y41_12650 [Spirochaetes bacterium GWB1_36_13]HCL56323.1 hypothetical protein [Spirochaetia bacterium]